MGYNLIDRNVFVSNFDYVFDLPRKFEKISDFLLLDLLVRREYVNVMIDSNNLD